MLAYRRKSGKITRMESFNFIPGPHPGAWQRPPARGMRAPAVLFATHRLLESLDVRVIEQLENIATLPGIVNAAYAMQGLFN